MAQNRLSAPMKPEVDVKGYAAGLRAITDRPYIQTAAYTASQWRADRIAAQGDLLEFEKRFIAKAKKLDVPLYAHTMWRRNEEQDRLYIMGKSKAKAGESPHNYGCAVDIVHCVKHWALDPVSWLVLGHVGKEIAQQAGIEMDWGGDWKQFHDPAHWQLSDWKTRRDHIRRIV